MTMCRTISMALCAVALGACGETAPGEQVHPVLAEAAGALLVPGATAPQHLAQLQADFDSARPMVSIGAVDGPQETLFGHIPDIAAGADGDVYVLDAMYNQVRLFGSDGTYKGAFGNKGDGPDEFRDPVALVQASDGAMVVATRSTLKFFRGTGSDMKYERQIPLGEVASPRDVCAIGGTFYIRAHDRERNTVVTAMDADGTVRNHFGSGYAHGNWLVRRQLSDGFVGCTGSTVVVAYHSLPDLRGYSAAGDELWHARIAEFIPGQVLEGTSPEGLEQVQTISDEPADRVLGLSPGPDGTVVVHVGRLEPAEGSSQAVSGIRSYLIDGRTGAAVPLRQGVPFVMAVRDDLVYAMGADRSSGVPTVEVHAIPRRHSLAR